MNFSINDLINLINGEVAVRVIGSSDTVFIGRSEDIPLNLYDCSVALFYADCFRINILVFSKSEQGVV